MWKQETEITREKMERICNCTGIEDSKKLGITEEHYPWCSAREPEPLRCSDCGGTYFVNKVTTGNICLLCATEIMDEYYRIFPALSTFWKRIG